jgi:p24 family protein beta-1
MLLFPLAFSLLALLGSSLAHNINLRAHSRECFHEQLHKDDRMTVTFQVADREFGGSGNLDIDFWVRFSFIRLEALSYVWIGP